MNEWEELVTELRRQRNRKEAERITCPKLVDKEGKEISNKKVAYRPLFLIFKKWSEKDVVTVKLVRNKHNLWINSSTSTPADNASARNRT